MLVHPSGRPESVAERGGVLDERAEPRVLLDQLPDGPLVGVPRPGERPQRHVDGRVEGIGSRRQIGHGVDVGFPQSQAKAAIGLDQLRQLKVALDPDALEHRAEVGVARCGLVQFGQVLGELTLPAWSPGRPHFKPLLENRLDLLPSLSHGRRRDLQVLGDGLVRGAREPEVENLPVVGVVEEVQGPADLDLDTGRPLPLRLSQTARQLAGEPTVLAFSLLEPPEHPRLVDDGVLSAMRNTSAQSSSSLAAASRPNRTYWSSRRPSVERMSCESKMRRIAGLSLPRMRRLIREPYRVMNTAAATRSPLRMRSSRS